MGAPCTHHGTGCSMIWGAPRAGERPVAWPWGVPWGHPQGTPQLPVAPRAVPCHPPCAPARHHPTHLLQHPPGPSRKKKNLCLDGPVQKSQILWFLRVGKPPKRHNPPQFPAIGLAVPRATSSRGVPSLSARRLLPPGAVSWAKRSCLSPACSPPRPDHNLQYRVKPSSTVSLIIPSINDKHHSFRGSHYKFIPLFNVLTNISHPAARREILNNPFWKSRADTARAILDLGREMGEGMLAGFKMNKELSHGAPGLRASCKTQGGESRGLGAAGPEGVLPLVSEMVEN